MDLQAKIDKETALHNECLQKLTEAKNLAESLEQERIMRVGRVLALQELLQESTAEEITASENEGEEEGPEIAAGMNGQPEEAVEVDA